MEQPGNNNCANGNFCDAGTSASLHSIHFPDENMGWVIGSIGPENKRLLPDVGYRDHVR